ncbi:hypothetical protein GPJ56_005983 [Histomonas meleagridis]|uniref:uncharacterized protein n=1 Tax=Histomonas meleagridis TaxID=135588 RepID=UPI00355AB337|nr:hypothetical protein GPJ56_005983 [Histomonas meleagridis]KAH0799390.1 hypothetical protein GO595_007791 [Histomonas meleagridis]
MSTENEEISSTSSSSSSSNIDPRLLMLGEYCPFIADVPILSYAEPFPIDEPDPRSEEEIESLRKKLRKQINNKSFDPPIPLSDFCLIAKERWEQNELDAEASLGLCVLL